MILDNTLNLDASIGLFLSPDDRKRDNLLEDLEKGGLFVNNPAGELQLTNWHIYNVGFDIFCNRLIDTDEPKFLFSVSTVPSEINFTFDSNMQPQVAYVENGVVKFRWFDSEVEKFTTTIYENVYSPRLCLDDKRKLETAYRDVLLFYIKIGPPDKLCYRQQRDRYTIERELMEVPENTKRLGRVGMATTRRVQIEFITQK